MQTVIDGFNATGAGGQVYSWIDDPAARVAAPGLHGRSVLSDLDLSRADVDALVETALWLKIQRERAQPHPYLAGKTLGMLFQHPSTRTRNAFQAGMEQLGGHATFLGAHELQLTRGETLPDTAQILSRYVDGIAARFGAHEDLIVFMGGASVPVYNALTERFHPIEALSDLLTLHDQFGGLKGLKLTYVGDGNNVCHSLMLSGAAAGMHVAVASPDRFAPDHTLVERARELAAQAGGSILVTGDPAQAVSGADAVYTDVHESMGQPDDPQKRLALAPYKVTVGLMAEAQPAAVFMHCLPMQRDMEVEAAVADGPQSIVFEQAANRLHMHKAVLLLTMG
ncbi:MAG: ornithine carbamoyltransferase [Thermomicrobiales bacterium]|nr:ornithine carbamoyltransferase [Thermomicrobiales bacterium]